VPGPPAGGVSDLDLYREIADAVRSGQNYYTAAVEQQVKFDYPVTPASTVRLPTAAFVVAALGETGAYILLLGLLGIGVIGALFCFEKLTNSRTRWFGSMLLMAASLALIAAPAAVLFSETWAFVLMLLALTYWNPKRIWPAVLLGLAAVCFRELALPFLVSMAFAAGIEKRWREVAAWLSAGAAFLCLYLVHVFAVAEGVAQVVSGSPPSSPGWVYFGGWPFVVDLVRSTTPLSALPYTVAAVLSGLALLGWYSVRRSSTGLRFLLASLSFMLPFMAIGRSQNTYWGLLFAALLIPGAAFVSSRIFRSIKN